MEGRNHLGRRISLLNEEARTDTAKAVASISSSSRPLLAQTSFPQLALPLRATSRTFSYASSSANSSPTTPQLVRSDSEYSSAMNRTPSPTTPSYIDFNGLAGAGPNKQDGGPFIPAPPGSSFFGASATGAELQMSIQNPQYTYPIAIAPVANPVQSQGPAPTEQVASSSKSAPKQSTKKNSYPCPLAKQYNCQDHFTTSGHAARHAKKHTGKKDAFCPECNKAFTRKDNMEQHRRTHQNGRNATKNGESAAKRQRTSKRASTVSSTAAAEQAVAATAHMQASMPTSMGVSMGAPSMLDPSLAHSPASSFGFPDAAFVPNMNPVMNFQDQMMNFSAGPYPPQSPTMVLDPALTGQMPNGMANGLDTLAMAAAKRDEHF